LFSLFTIHHSPFTAFIPEFEEPLLEDARKIVDIAGKVRDFVLEKLSETLKGENSQTYPGTQPEEREKD